MTSKIRQEIRHTSCFKPILSLWCNLGGKSNDHQKTAWRGWNQSEKREPAAPLKVKWSWCFTLHQRDRIFQTGHSLPHRPGRTWLPLPPGHCFVLWWAHLSCWTCSLFAVSIPWITLQPSSWSSLTLSPPRLPSEARKWTAVPEWP